MTKLNKFRHFYLYAKHWYKMTDRIEDLQKLVADYTGNENPKTVLIKDIINVLEDAVYELLEGKLNSHARILRAIHVKSHPMILVNGSIDHANPTIEEILIEAYIYILHNAEGKEISGWVNDVPGGCLGSPNGVLPLDEDFIKNEK